MAVKHSCKLRTQSCDFLWQNKNEKNAKENNFSYQNVFSFSLFFFFSLLSDANKTNNCHKRLFEKTNKAKVRRKNVKKRAANHIQSHVQPFIQTKFHITSNIPKKKDDDYFIVKKKQTKNTNKKNKNKNKKEKTLN